MVGQTEGRGPEFSRFATMIGLLRLAPLHERVSVHYRGLPRKSTETEVIDIPLPKRLTEVRGEREKLT